MFLQDKNVLFYLLIIIIFFLGGGDIFTLLLLMKHLFSLSPPQKEKKIDQCY